MVEPPEHITFFHSDTEDDDDEPAEPIIKKRRGRPPGSRNRTTSSKDTRKEKLSAMLVNTQYLGVWGLSDDERTQLSNALCAPDAPGIVKTAVDFITNSSERGLGFGIGIGIFIGVYAVNRIEAIDNVRDSLARRKRERNTANRDDGREARTVTPSPINDSSGVAASGTGSDFTTENATPSPKTKVAGILGIA